MSGGGKSLKEIPSGSRKMVQSLKEIVNFASEIEIYAMLKECNMDPNEAVHRLLSQDTFHEVKSKREKKRETKDTPDSKSRPMNNNPSRAARCGTERGVRANSGQTGSYDYGVTHSKPVPKKENGTDTLSSSLFAGSATAGDNLNRKSTNLCEADSGQNTTQAMSLANGPFLPSKAPTGFQHNWSRIPGQMSMADIVRMGRPQVKASGTRTVANDTLHTSHDPILSNMSHQSAKEPPTTIAPSDSYYEFNTSQDPTSHGEERSRELGTGAGHYNSYDDWSLAGPIPAGTGSIHPEISEASTYDYPSASSSLLADESNVERHPGFDENQIQEEDVNGECLTESIRETSVSDGEDTGESAYPDDDPLNDMSPYHTQRHAFEQHGVEDVDEEISTTTANLQQLNLQKGEPGAPSADDNPAVIIPSHLQVTNADCSHLSFGSFGSGGSATIPGSFSSKPLRSNLEMAPLPEDTTLEQLNSRNPEYYDGAQLKSTLDENVTPRTSTSTLSHDVPATSQPEIVRDEALASSHRLQEKFPSGSDYAFSATTPSTATYNYPDPTSQMQNLSHFSSLMQPYTNSLPSSLLASTAPPLREYDIPLSALLTTQSMPSKYHTTTPSISGPISMPEVKPEVFSSTQPAPQAMPGSNIPQHLQMHHPYSHQPTLPLGHFANMIGYPFLPQSYTYLPSAAFQQAYASGSPFHQSQAAVAAAAAMKYAQLPQYKTSISGSNLAQSPAFPPGYGGFASSTNSIPGSFSLNPTTASVNTTMGFEEALNSQYKEGSHYLPLQHNDNTGMWIHGAGSRTVSAHPSNTYYGFQGGQQQQQQQSQPTAGFRQAQQLPPSQYGQMGYLNMYQSQQGGGPAQEPHQQQNPSEGNLGGGSQGQMWQHGY